MSSSTTEEATVDVTMPDIDSEAGVTLVAWLKEPGQTVDLDEPICLVSWNETTAEVGSPAAGVLRMLAVAGGTTVPTGTSLALIDIRLAPVETDSPEGEDGRGEPDSTELEDAGEEADGGIGSSSRIPASPPSASPRVHAADAPSPASAPSPPQSPPVAETSDRVPEHLLRDAPSAKLGEVDLGAFHSPAVRRLAAKLGIDPGTVPGTGLGGRVTLRDVRAHAQAPAISAERA